MISGSHSNRRLYNWLVYNIGDFSLEKYIPYYKGVMYDLGSGESAYKDFFLQHVDKYIAVDWAESLHDLRADVFADLNNPLPIESNTANTVISLSVLEHLHSPRIFLGEAYRILKKGGLMILQVPFQWHVHEAPHDYFRYTPYGLKYLFEDAGFVDITIEPQSGFFSMVTLKINYFSLRFIRGPRPLRILIKAFLIPFWYIGQVCAPYLDKLDNNWSQETTGYYVVARKA
jgi:SAM-dependent methyltransferase